MLRRVALIALSALMLIGGVTGLVRLFGSGAAEAAATVDVAKAKSMLVSAHSGRCADVPGGRKDAGQVVQWDCRDRAWQLWEFKPTGQRDVYTVRNSHTGQCLDARGNGKANSTRVITWACHDRANQQWRVIGTGAGRFALRGVASNRCLDVAGAGKANGVGLIIYDCNGKKANQTWMVKAPKVAAVGPAPVVWEQQRLGYTCGPTSTRIALTALMPNPPSQDALAREEGTSSSVGTPREGIARVMNAQDPGPREWAYVPRGNSDVGHFVRLLSAARAKGLPVLLGVLWQTGDPTPPGWIPQQGEIDHWVVAVDYNPANGGSVQVVDPASGRRHFNPQGKYWIPMSTLNKIYKTAVYPRV